MSLALDSERYRAERLESQMNDLTELHQVCMTFKIFNKIFIKKILERN